MNVANKMVCGKKMKRTGNAMKTALSTQGNRYHVNRWIRLCGHGCFVVLLFAIQVSIEAKLTLRLSQESVDSGEFTELVLESDTQTSETPDFKPLEEDFTLSNFQSQSSISIVNGKYTSSRIWRVRLMPNRIGDLVIPPIRVGSDQTNPITIRVRELRPEVAEALKNAAFYELTVEPQEQYVQGAIYITRRLYLSNRVQRESDSSTGFDVNDAVFIPINDAYDSRDYRNGQAYDVHHIEVAMFPQKSGELVLKPITTNVSMVNPRTGKRIAVMVSTEETIINVLPIPTEYPADKPWLPATSVRLEDQFSPSSWQSIQVGTPLVRTITVRAKDTYSTAIPDIQLNVPDLLKAYPDAPETTQTATNSHISSSKVSTFNMIPVSSGQGELGKIALTWWNTSTRKVETAELSAKRFHIESDLVASPAVSDSELSSESVSNGPSPVPESKSSTMSLDAGLDRTVMPWWMIVLMATGWIAALVLSVLLIARRSRKNLQRESVSLSAVRRAYKQQDLLALKHTMLEWLARECELSMIEATQIFEEDEHGRSFVREVNDAIYAREPISATLSLDEIIGLLCTLTDRNLPSKKHPAKGPVDLDQFSPTTS